jgi:hypothetical protein
VKVDEIWSFVRVKHRNLATAKVISDDENVNVSLYAFDRWLLEGIENHACAMALHAIHYNLVCTHQTIKIAPAMAAGANSCI